MSSKHETVAKDRTLVISDFSRVVEQDLISTVSAKGKWWLRPYRAEDGLTGRMLCVEERDKDQPESCIAPPITLPLNLSGVYQVWIGTYRPQFGGGIDARLSGDKYFRHMDPQQVPANTAGEDHSGKLVELLFHEGVELNGQNLVFQQPYGTYQSLYWGYCASHLAYVRLIRLTDEEIKRQETYRLKTKIPYGFDNDGYSYFWMWGTEKSECVERLVESLRHGDASFWNFCIGNHGNYRWFETPFTDYDGRAIGSRLGDHRAYRVRQALLAHYGKDGGIIKALIDRTHAIGKEIYLSQRMSEGVADGPVARSHPEWRLPRRGNTWDYAHPQVQQLTHDSLCWIAEKYDADGITLDFSRLAECFRLEEPDKFGLMNNLVRRLRKSFDRINEQKRRNGKPPVKLIASWVENVGYLKRIWNYGYFFHEQGLDIRTWLEEDLFDIIMPEGPGVERYAAIARDITGYRQGAPYRPSKTKVYPRHCCYFRFGAADAQVIEIDPAADEDKKDVLRYGGIGPIEIERGWLNWLTHGQDGLFLFNYDMAHMTLGRMGDPEGMKQRVADNQPYGMLDQQRIAF